MTRIALLTVLLPLTALAACADETEEVRDTADADAQDQESAAGDGEVGDGDALDAGDSDASTSDAGDADASVDGGSDVACSLIDQTCDDGSKCAIVSAPGGPFTAACVDDIGDVAEGDECERTSEGFGHDDCAPGSFCSFIGEAGPDHGGVRRCHALCDDDAQCPDANRCAILVEEQGGFCGPTCEPFADCGTDLTCGDMYSGTDSSFDLWLACRPMGVLNTGDACATSYECPADHICTDPMLGNDLRCLALCDEDHACQAGTCTNFGGLSFCI